MDLNQLKIENGELTVVSRTVCSGETSLAFKEFLKNKVTFSYKNLDLVDAEQ